MSFNLLFSINNMCMCKKLYHVHFSSLNLPKNVKTKDFYKKKRILYIIKQFLNIVLNFPLLKETLTV